jgi:HSP20 family protein
MPKDLIQRMPAGLMADWNENPLLRLQRDFDMLLSRFDRGFFDTDEPELSSARVWDFTIAEKDGELAVRAEVPGFEPDEIDVQLDNNFLQIKAESRRRDRDSERYRSFVRTVALPKKEIDSDKVQATYRNGVLELRIPCSDAARPRRIEVRANQPAIQGSSAQPAEEAASQRSDSSLESNVGHQQHDSGESDSQSSAGVGQQA